MPGSLGVVSFAPLVPLTRKACVVFALLLSSSTGAENASAADPAASRAAPALTKPPALLSAPDVGYPEGEEAEGVIALRVTIDAQGLVQRVDVVRGLTPALDWAALGAATGFVFSPAETAEGPIPVVIEYQLAFARDGEATAPDDERVTGAPSSTDAPVEPATLRGRLRVAGGAVPLAQAEVAVVDVESEEVALAYTDADGRFTVSGLAPGRYRVEISAFGYDPLVLDQTLAPGADAELRVSLRTDVGDPFETVIRAERTGAAVSRVTLTRDEVEAIPGTFGDALRVVESLPGAARTPFLGGGLVLRGGMPGDSRIFVDGVEIPILFHWGGLSSVINAAFLEELSVYPGGFPVEYGRATAGIVDVKSHALDLDGFVASMDADIADLGFFFAGPVQVGQLPKVSFGFAARRSYLEGMGAVIMSTLPLLGAPLTFLPVPRYFDFQAKAEVRPLEGHRLALTVLASDDRFGFLGEEIEIPVEDLSLEELINNVVANEMLRVIGEHEWRLFPGVTNVLRPYVGTTRRGALADNVVVNLFSGSALSTPERQRNWGVRDELRATVAPWLSLTAGLEHVGKTFAFGLGPPFVDEDAECPEQPPPGQLCLEPFLAEGTQLGTGVYGRLELRPLRGISLYPGVRVEHSLLEYTDRYQHLADGQVIAQNFVAVDPRLAARWQLLRTFSLKGSFGLYQMAPAIEESVLDDDGRALLPERALHAVVGFEHAFSDDITLDAQVYGIRRDQLVRNGRKLWTPEGGRAELLPLDLPGSFDSFGRGQTVGVELLLRHQPTRWFFGWIAYTFSHTWLDDGAEQDPYHPSPFDQTHNLILVARVNLPWEMTLGGRFQYATGNPSPLPGTLAVVHDLSSPYPGGAYLPIEDPGRRPRNPDFHRLDVRLDKKLTFEGFTLGAYVEVMNVYNRLNAEVVAPGGDFRGRGTIVVLPSTPFLPSVGVSGSF